MLWSQQQALPGIEEAEHMYFASNFNTNRHSKDHIFAAMPYPKVEDVYIQCGNPNMDEDFNSLYLKVRVSING